MAKIIYNIFYVIIKHHYAFFFLVESNYVFQDTSFSHIFILNAAGKNIILLSLLCL